MIGGNAKEWNEMFTSGQQQCTYIFGALRGYVRVECRTVEGPALASFAMVCMQVVWVSNENFAHVRNTHASIFMCYTAATRAPNPELTPAIDSRAPHPWPKIASRLALACV